MDPKISTLFSSLPSRVDFETGKYGLNSISHIPAAGQVEAIVRALFGSSQIVYGSSELIYGMAHLIPTAGQKKLQTACTPYYPYILEGRENIFHGISNIIRAVIEFFPILGQLFAYVYDNYQATARHFYSSEKPVFEFRNDYEKKVRRFEKRKLNKYGSYPIIGTFSAIGRIILAATEILFGLGAFFYGIFGILPRFTSIEEEQKSMKKQQIRASHYIAFGRDFFYHGIANFIRACFEGVPLMGLVFSNIYDQQKDENNPLRFSYLNEQRQKTNKPD